MIRGSSATNGAYQKVTLPPSRRRSAAVAAWLKQIKFILNPAEYKHFRSVLLPKLLSRKPLSDEEKTINFKVENDPETKTLFWEMTKYFTERK